jgi:hypothetical protein
VHEGVEAILRAFKASRCTSLADERAVATLRSLGGYTAVAVAALRTVLADLANNPRMIAQVDRVRERLDRRVPEMRRAIQALVSRISVAPSQAASSLDLDSPAMGGRSRLRQGAHPEATLVAEDVRFMGRVDLLTVHADHVDVIDFKSGQPSDHHSDQVTLYGLLWVLDDIANPDRLPVGSLTLAYVGRDEPVSLPQDWEATRRTLEEQIRWADQAVGATPPAALPSTECWRCPVRHICDEYWESTFAGGDPGSIFVDAEVVVLRQNGPRSWLAELARGSEDVLIRTMTEDDALQAGQRLRVLDAAVGHGDDESWTVLTITGGSEMFSVNSAWSKTDRPGG